MNSHTLTSLQAGIIRDNLVKLQASADGIDHEDPQRCYTLKLLVLKLTEECLKYLPESDF